jgi:hypothetical protein
MRMLEVAGSIPIARPIHQKLTTYNLTPARFLAETGKVPKTFSMLGEPQRGACSPKFSREVVRIDRSQIPSVLKEPPRWVAEVERNRAVVWMPAYRYRGDLAFEGYIIGDSDVIPRE